MFQWIFSNKTPFHLTAKTDLFHFLIISYSIFVLTSFNFPIFLASLPFIVGSVPISNNINFQNLISSSHDYKENEKKIIWKDQRWEIKRRWKRKSSVNRSIVSASTLQELISSYSLLYVLSGSFLLKIPNIIDQKIMKIKTERKESIYQ